jgi:hypothetical protein
MDEKLIDSVRMGLLFVLFILAALLNGATCNDIDVRC